MIKELENFINPFYLTRLRVNCVAIEKMKIPGYKGFSLYNSFKTALAGLSGYVNFIKTGESVLGDDLYKHFFYTEIPADNQRSRSLKEPPRAFIFEPADLHISDYDPGDRLVFDLLLLGETVNFLDKIPAVIEKMGKNGLGSRDTHTNNRGRFMLYSIIMMSPNGSETLYYADGYFAPRIKPRTINLKNTVVPDLNPRKVKMIFHHPLTLIYDGKVPFHTIHFNMVTTNLVNRILLLSNLFCRTPFKEINTEFIKEGSIRICSERVKPKTYKKSLLDEGYKKYTGLRGEIEFEGNLKPWLKLLAFGRQVHIGSHTAYGFGTYLFE